MKIIALGHKSRVGKDTLAKFIISHVRQNSKNLKIGRVSFASPLKETCHKLFGHLRLEPEEYYDRPENEAKRDIVLPGLNKTPVETWIEVGNKLREVYPYTWIDYAFNSCPYDLVVITDMRFENEAYKVEERGGARIKITNPRAPIRNSVSDKALDSYTKWTEEFCNDDDFNKLNNYAIDLCKRYFDV